MTAAFDGVPAVEMSEMARHDKLADEIDKEIEAATVDEDNPPQGKPEGEPATPKEDGEKPSEPKDEKPSDEGDEESEKGGDEPGYTPELLARAAALGIPINQFDAATAQQVVDTAEFAAFRRFQQLNAPPQQQQPWQQNPGQQPGQPPWQQQPAPPQFMQPPPGQQHWQQQPPAPTWPGQPPQQPGFEQSQQPFELNLKPEELDDVGIVETFQKMKAHYDQQNQSLQMALQQQQEFVTNWEQQQQADHNRWFDDEISKLGDESVYGKGRAEAISDEEWHQRQSIYQTYQGYLEFNGGQSNARDAELLARVVQMSNGGPSSSQKQLSDKLKLGEKKTIGRPTGRKSSIDDSGRNSETGLTQATVDDLDKFLQDMLNG